MDKIVYLFDEQGFFVGQMNAQRSPLEKDVFLLPKAGTFTPPPESSEALEPQFVDGSWSLVTSRVEKRKKEAAVKAEIEKKKADAEKLAEKEAKDLDDLREISRLEFGATKSIMIGRLKAVLGDNELADFIMENIEFRPKF